MNAKALHWIAVAGALCSAIGLVCVELAWLAAFEALCGTGLVAGHAFVKSKLVRTAELTLIVQTLILGAAWPSALTIAALAVAPAGFLALRNTVERASSNRSLVYIAASSGVSAWSLALEAWRLATL